MGVTMQLPRDAILLRVFFGEDDKFERLPLHEAIVLKAREMHLAGATVLRGHVGFGHSSHIHTTKILRLSQDLPVVVEIVDTQAKIDSFLPVLDTMMTSGLVTIEKVQVLQYGTDSISIVSE
jgi:PII-like signaling protein